MSRSAQPHVHQDYLARIRYSNALPPPPFYPKLLDIPNAGLSSGLYTSANYASRVAREQPLNIEVDAELGMPLDLVGIKGVFEGDDSAIMFESDPPPLHPKDKELLRPLNALGKPVTSNNAVSFLRRTEYMSSTSAVNKLAAKNNALRSPGAPLKNKRKADVNKDDPISILRGIAKGFDIAYPHDAYTGPDSEQNIRSAEITAQEKHAWARPKHPTKPNVTLVDSYPILPDLDAFPDTGNYVLIKFQANPSEISSHYDPRLDVLLLRPQAQTQEEQEEQAAREALAVAERRSKPTVEYRYDVFIPETADSVPAIKRKLDTTDSSRDSDDLYDYENTQTGRKAFRYKRLRAYETYQQVGTEDAWNDSVGMVLNDGDGGRLKRGAYLYPIVQRTFVRSRPKVTLGSLARGGMNDEEEKVDGIELGIRAMDETEEAQVQEHKSKWDPSTA